MLIFVLRFALFNVWQRAGRDWQSPEMCEDGQLASRANLAMEVEHFRFFAHFRFVQIFNPSRFPTKPHVLLIPSGFILLEFKCVAPRVQVAWIFYGSPLLLWVGKSEDEGEKKQMLMRFLAKLRPLLWMHLKKLKQTAGESQVFPPWSSLKKPSTKIFGDFLKSVGWNVPVWSLTIW